MTLVLFLIILCSPGYAAESKILVALINFTDETPNKMILSPGERDERNDIHLSEVMQIIWELTEKSGLFKLLPQKTVEEVMKTQIGKEAVARRYDRFSSARLGKMLGVDVILTGEIVQFNKNTVPRDLTINGIDFSSRVDDVVIKARLINAYNGMEILNVSGSGVADENVLESVSAAVVNRLSIGFVQATKISVMQILREIGSADIVINKENYSSSKSFVDMIDYTVVKTEGKYIYINAGRSKDISVADLFTIMKKDERGRFIPVAVYMVSMVELNSSQLLLVEPADESGLVLVGDKAQRRFSGTEIEIKSQKKSENDKKFTTSSNKSRKKP